MSHPLRRVAPAFVLAFSLGAGTRAAAASTIELLPQATVAGPDVTLGEVAQVQAADAKTVAVLRALPLGPAPHVGFERQVHPADIERALRASGWDARDVAFTGARVATVHVMGANVQADALVRCASDALKAALVARYRDVKLAPVDAPVMLTLPVAQIGYRARPALLPKPLARRVAQWVDIYADGRLYRSIPVTFEVSARMEVLVAGRDLAQGSPLGSDGATLREVDASRVDVEPVAAASLNDGLLVRHGIAAGAPLTWRDVGVMPAVKHGDWVVLRVSTGAIRIEERAQALEDGQPGAHVRVKAASGAELSARVVGNGVVEADGS